ncbi:MAG: DUF4417 domain-containing protein [Erysipelotrichaceae bacterium]|nr:DUF4417 domain-containing protein [Erysipelotrichaceae bacterium]
MAKKSFISDGCNPEFVVGAHFDGVFEIPVIEKPSKIVIPSSIIPFSQRNRMVEPYGAVGFYEMDSKFSDVIKNPEKYVDDFRRFQMIISPDCSLYRDAPVAVQITNTYKNRAIGSFLQRQGLYVIPQIRWGSEATYTTKILPERIAFLGVRKRSIVAIGTYGCIQHRYDKFYFEAGLEAMLESLEPEVVLVYGSMPESVFSKYTGYTRFVQYDNWITVKHRGNN